MRLFLRGGGAAAPAAPPRTRRPHNKKTPHTPPLFPYTTLFRSGEGIAVTVVNVHTIKPLDRETILREARAAGAVVTVEEHQIAGGFGSAIAELLAQECPLPIEFIGVHDQFGQSGEPNELIEHYKMGTSYIMDAVKKVIVREEVL